MRDGLTPATAIFSDRVSGRARGGKMRLGRDERGAIGLIGTAIIGILAIFGFSTAAAINWEWLVAALMMTAVVLSVFGVVILKQDPKIIMITVFAVMAIAFIIKVTVPMVIALAIFVGLMWHFKIAVKKPLIFMVLVVVGLGAMVLGSQMVLLPLGIIP